MDLCKGGLNSSLDLIYAQVATLTARIDSAQVKTHLLKSSVDLIRSSAIFHRKRHYFRKVSVPDSTVKRDSFDRKDMPSRLFPIAPF